MNVWCIGGLFMKVHNNSIYMGDDVRSARHEEYQKSGSKQGKTIDGSSLQARFDPIASKREEAKKKAMKIVGDAFANERKIDDDLDARRERIKSLQAERSEAKKTIREVEDNRAALRASYGVDGDSQEEKDLKLLEKEIDAKMPGNSVTISREEAKRIAEIKANGLTEYQQRSLEMKEWEIPYANTAYEAEQAIKMENQVISATKLERLKTHPMLDAKEQAEAIMDAASDEIVGMLIDEGKEHIDEETEKRKEAAKEKAEEKEELEARIEKNREEKKEKEKVTEEILEGAAEVVNNTKDMKAAQQEIKDMMNKMKLIEDDIKGATVDKSL